MKYLLFITMILISSYLYAQDKSITNFDLKNALQSVLDNHKTIKAQKIDIGKKISPNNSRNRHGK